MPCLNVPLPTPPAPPAGLTLPTFQLPSLPQVGLCCNLPIPSYPLPIPALPIPYLAAEVAALMAYVQAAQLYLEGLLQVSCPLDG